MKRRNVELHSLHPYDFQKAGDTTYYFETENGLRYRAYFIEFSATFYKMYSFSMSVLVGMYICVHNLSINPKII